MVEASSGTKSSGETTWDHVKGVLGAATALLGVLAVLVYGGGALVLGLRLAFERLPPLDVLGVVPQTSLRLIGALEVALPAVVAAGVAAGWFFTHPRLDGAPPHHVRWANAAGAARTRLQREVIAAALLTPVPGAVVSVITYEGFKVAHVSLLVPVAVGFGAAMVYVHARARIAERWKGRNWNGVVPVLLRSALLGMLALPMIVATAAAFELQDARVCFRPTDQGTTRPPYDGFYVANTKDFAYIGESGSGTRRIRQFSGDLVEEVIHGRDVQSASC